MGILEDLYRQVPLNARLFTDSLRGVTTPLTEKDLRPDEIKVLQDIYTQRQNQIRMANEFANKNPTYSAQDKLDSAAQAQKLYGSKQVGYGDYAPHLFDLQNWLQSAYNSFTDPRYRIATSLGNFGMEPQGNNLRIYDKYNWNGDFDKPIKSLADVFRSTSMTNPTQVLNGLAELFAPKVSRPVEINIPQK